MTQIIDLQRAGRARTVGHPANSVGASVCNQLLLATYIDAERSVRIIENRHDGSRLYYDHDALDSHVDARGENLLKYIEYMALLLKGRTDVLLLGTAGGALVTRLSRSGAAVSAVDDWEIAFALARRWFFLPVQVRCITADALSFLQSAPRRWSAIAIDLFHGGEAPESMLTAEIGPLLSAVLDKGGVVVWNFPYEPKPSIMSLLFESFAKSGFASSIVALKGRLEQHIILLSVKQ